MSLSPTPFDGYSRRTGHASHDDAVSAILITTNYAVRINTTWYEGETEFNIYGADIPSQIMVHSTSGDLSQFDVYVRGGEDFLSWTPQQQNIETGETITTAAVSGETIAIGCESADNFRGKVFIYVRSGSTWSLQQTLTASPNPADGDNFGHDLSLNGDTLIVASNGDDSSAGSVYVFTRSGSTWSQRTILTASDRASGDHFGDSVALGGDGYAVIGAAHEFGGGDGYNAGAAYLFYGSGASWSQHAKLVAPSRQNGAWFGLSVSIDDGYDICAVGAYGDDGQNDGDGAAYVFRISDGYMLQKLIPDDEVYDGTVYYGSSLAIDGYMLAVGQWDIGGDGGKVYVYDGSSGTWMLDTTLSDNTGSGLSNFPSIKAIAEEI